MKASVATKTMRSQLLGGLLGLLTTTYTACAQTVPICQVFDDLPSYAGKVVTVRGLLYQGKEIFALGGHCRNAFVTTFKPTPLPPGVPEVIGQFEWPTAIHLQTSSAKRALERQSVDFETDVNSMRRTEVSIEDQRNAVTGGRSIEVDTLVTIVGLLEMRPSYTVASGANGRLMGNGFGHLAMYPAQLTIITMGDPVVAVSKSEPVEQQPSAPKTGTSKPTSGAK